MGLHRLTSVCRECFSVSLRETVRGKEEMDAFRLGWAGRKIVMYRAERSFAGHNYRFIFKCVQFCHKSERHFILQQSN